MLSEKERTELMESIRDVVMDGNFKRSVPDALWVSMTELSPLQRRILVEKHLISPQHAENPSGKGLVLGLEGTLSIMVNEEDHLRMQCLFPGLQLHEGYRTTSNVDDALESTLDFAFSEDQGYLTACPTNVGTGLRASVMMHLAGLRLIGQAGRVLSALSQVGLAVRGLYGEGSEATGNLFQISNQITQGVSEEEIINNLSMVVKKLIDQEHDAREMLLNNSSLKLEDRVNRAWGILASARMISSSEALELLSEVRLGAELKLIPGVDTQSLNLLLVEIQPAYLQQHAGKELDAQERDRLRAEVIREKIKFNL